MINAGRVLIIPKGEWTNLESYEMLDLVTRGDIAYIARQASVGVDPATDTQLTYWQPFGTAAKIATTTTPGLVMPDGTTVTIDATGLISANIGISDINNVTITSISNGQILQYNSSTQKWENKSLGSAASRNATSSITSGSTDLIESGAVSSLKQTLETQVSTKADQSLIAPIQTTLIASKPYTIDEQFVYQGLLYTATAAIAQGSTITINGNCKLSDRIAAQIKTSLFKVRDNYTLTEVVRGSSDTTYTIATSGYYNLVIGIGATISPANIARITAGSLRLMDVSAELPYNAVSGIFYIEAGTKLSFIHGSSTTIFVVYSIT